MPTAAAMPSGVVTFLFTDIEGSTQRWESDPGAMRNALTEHDAVLRAAIEEYRGSLFKHTGDGTARRSRRRPMRCTRRSRRNVD